MTTIRTLAAAAAVIAGLNFGPGIDMAAAQTKSPDVVYNAPSWWITAVIQGKQSTLLTGDTDLDRRMNVWLVGFGHGFGDRCGTPEGRALRTVLDRQIAERPAMKEPGKHGISDGRRFAEINGCSSQDATAVRRTIAGIGGSFDVADARDRRDMDRQDMDRRNADRRDTERRDPERQQIAAAREAIVVNRSGMRIDILRMSETTDDDWGVDRLGRDVLDHGQGVRVPLAGARSCTYDLRVVYADRRIEQRMNVNLCTGSQVVFDGSHARLPRQAANEQPSLAVNGTSSR